MGRGMRIYWADLHIHTCLSPCAELDMTPKRIIKRAAAKGLDMIAVTDHNSAGNLSAALGCAEGGAVAVIPGMEITSAEEVHILALFETIDSAAEMQRQLYDGGDFPPDAGHKAFGTEQVIVNVADEILGFEPRLLAGASSKGLEDIIGAVHALGGLAIASHSDRESFSVLSQLGFFPDDAMFDAIEVTGKKPDTLLPAQFPRLHSSDAHSPDMIGRKKTGFMMEAPTFRELAMAIKGEGGRGIRG